MPTLNWIGKEQIINHHNDVPFRVLERKYTFGEIRNEKVEIGNEKVEIRNEGNADNQISNSTFQISNSKIIHGDNLEALKALLPEYEGRIKCIYIDPPYNTGNENWVYNDNVNSPKIRKWLGQVVGKESEDLSRHDKWLCMMYPRLVLLQKLLSDDGAIFISIDDNEQANLKLICDEIFGKNNFIAQAIWERAYSPVNLKKHFSESHDYIIVYAKNIDNLVCNGLPRTTESNERYANPDNDPRGVWKSADCSVGPVVQEKVYEIELPSGRRVLPSRGRCWVYTKERFSEMVADNRIWFGSDGNSVPAVKKFLSEVKQRITPMTIWKYTEVGHSQDATKKLKEIFDGKAVFDYPKSVPLIQRCLELYSDKSSIILDSFAGSGTTAHAVLNLNKADGGNRKFILVEMEDYAESITAERVKRVIDGYGDTEGTGGSFDFYELGEPVFDADGNLNENIGTEKIREYIWYSEIRNEKLGIRNVDDCDSQISNSSFQIPNSKYFLGKYLGTAYYFYYEKDQITTLDKAFLNTITQRAEQYVIYADNCLLSAEFMQTNHIIFKKIPRDVKKL